MIRFDTVVISKLTKTAMDHSSFEEKAVIEIIDKAPGVFL